MNIENWVEPHVLDAARGFEVERRSEAVREASVVEVPLVKSEEVRQIESRERKEYTRQGNEQNKRDEDSSGGLFGGFDMSSLLGMLGGGDDNPLMSLMMNFMGEGGKSGKGGFDMMSLLPMLLNSGLLNGFGGSVKRESTKSRVIDLGEYEIR